VAPPWPRGGRDTVTSSRVARSSRSASNRCPSDLDRQNDGGSDKSQQKDSNHYGSHSLHRDLPSRRRFKGRSSNLSCRNGGVPWHAGARSEAGGLVVGQAAWRLGISVRDYLELEAGARSPTFETWERICKLFGWHQTFAVTVTRGDD
jgi:hypothetical protein